MLLPLFNEAQVLQDKITKAQNHINDLESTRTVKGYAIKDQLLLTWTVDDIDNDPLRPFLTAFLTASKDYWTAQRDLLQAEFDAL